MRAHAEHERVPPSEVEVETGDRHWAARARRADATIREFAQQQPLVALFAAVSLGYLVGRLFRRI
jgi:hypothetical protein